MGTIELTTHPGLEDVAADELRTLTAATTVLRPEGRAGWVRAEVDLDDEALVSVARALRSVHRVIRPVAVGTLPAEEPLAWIRAWLAELSPGIRELDPEGARFRVRSARRGEHPFTSEQIEREAGAGIRAGRWRPVDLTTPDVEIRCDVDGATVRVGVTAPISLSRRHDGPFRPATALRPNVAWALCQLARPAGPPAARVLDPFVGSGSILVEAAARWPGARLAGSDREARCVDGTRENLVHHGLVGEVRAVDARALPTGWPEGGFDTVVTDPPFGRRHGSELDLVSFYRAFLRSAAEITTADARLALLAADRSALRRALAQVRAWETRHVRIVELGGLYVGAFVLGKTAER